MALAYQTALTIESVIKDIDSKKYLLPSIQREFVWSTGQIEKLFDSLMRDYPINAFLFWKVPREKVSEFKFYEFLRDYHQKALFKLYSIIHNKQTISYYLEESTELDKVLNIFIRVNSGGTTLSYSDLLLSFATAQWEHKDAREEINEFVEEVNMIGRGFNIGKDLILKSCLVLADFVDITFKVDNFNRQNMLVIEKNWDEYTDAIRIAVELMASFGFSRDNLNSNSILIPIAYYIKTIGNPVNFVDSKKYASDRGKIKKWIVASLLRRVFSSQPDGILRPVREIIQKNTSGAFPLEEIIDRFKGTNRDIKFTDDTIENLLWTKYGSSDALVVLSVLYPWADLKNVFHIDHIYPKSQFTERRLKKKGVASDAMEFYMNNVNYLGNLQLLDGTQNKGKNDSDFDVWLADNYKDSSKLKDYKEKNYIPDVSLAFTNFEEFFTEREKLLVNRLKKELM